MLVNVTLSVLLVSYLAGCSSTTAGLSIGTTNGTGESEQIPAKLFKPDGAGEFPAVVIMHDCSGLGPRSSGAPERWAKELLTYGYVVLSCPTISEHHLPADKLEFMTVLS